MHFQPIQDFFPKNMHEIKQKEILDRKVLKLQLSERFGPMLVELPN